MLRCLFWTWTAIFQNIIGGISSAVSAGNAASTSIASESLYHDYIATRCSFWKGDTTGSFAEGFKSEKEVLIFEQNIFLEGTLFTTSIIILPDSKKYLHSDRNRHSTKADIELNLARNKWNISFFFSETSKKIQIYIYLYLY